MEGIEAAWRFKIAILNDSVLIFDGHHGSHFEYLEITSATEG